MSRIRVYMGCSMDGYIAGPGNDLSWLVCEHAQPGDLPDDPAYLDFDGFFADVGCVLMGRTTYDVVEGMGQWFYGDRPVLVATRRPIAQPARPTVRAVSGDIGALLDAAIAHAGGQDVYIDGGNLVRQALAAARVDEITVTHVPVLLGRGTRLFDDIGTRLPLQFTRRAASRGMLQLTARVVSAPPPAGA